MDLLRIRTPENEIGIDPEPLTQFAHRCKDRGADPAHLYRQLKILMAAGADTAEKNSDSAINDVTLCYTLLLALGEWSWDELPDSVRTEKNNFGTWYRDHPSSAIHSACGWLMRTWKLKDESAFPLDEAVDEKIGSATFKDAYDETKEWFVLKLKPPNQIVIKFQTAWRLSRLRTAQFWIERESQRSC